MKFRLISACLALAVLAGCSQNKAGTAETTSSPASKELFAMDTYITLTAYGDGAEAALDEAAAKITEIEKRLSVTETDSDINMINSKAGSAVTVSEDTVNIINTALDFGRSTEGALDITVYPVLKEWGFTTGDYKIPDDETIDSLLEKVDYSKVSVEGTKVTIPEGSMIDTGAVTKGYTGDCLAEIFKSAGIDSALINLGGNVQTVGTKPDGSKWVVGIQDPLNTDSYVGTLETADKAVITSGNYERFFTGEDGKNYWHILDPKTGKPADKGIISATIIGNKGIDCDALSTSLFVLGTEAAIDYWKAHSNDFDVILVTDDNKLYLSSDLKDSFTQTSSYEINYI